MDHLQYFIKTLTASYTPTALLFLFCRPTEFRVALPWELYTDDMVVIAETILVSG